MGVRGFIDWLVIPTGLNDFPVLCHAGSAQQRFDPYCARSLVQPSFRKIACMQLFALGDVWSILVFGWRGYFGADLCLDIRLGPTNEFLKLQKLDGKVDRIFEVSLRILAQLALVLFELLDI